MERIKGYYNSTDKGELIFVPDPNGKLVMKKKSGVTIIMEDDSLSFKDVIRLFVKYIKHVITNFKENFSPTTV